jgi:hypothetical protein
VTRQEYWNEEKRVTPFLTLIGNGVGSGRSITTRRRGRIRRGGRMPWIFRGTELGRKHDKGSVKLFLIIFYNFPGNTAVKNIGMTVCEEDDG